MKIAEFSLGRNGEGATPYYWRGVVCLDHDHALELLALATLPALAAGEVQEAVMARVGPALRRYGRVCVWLRVFVVVVAEAAEETALLRPVLVVEADLLETFLDGVLRAVRAPVLERGAWLALRSTAGVERGAWQPRVELADGYACANVLCCGSERAGSGRRHNKARTNDLRYESKDSREMLNGSASLKKER